MTNPNTLVTIAQVQPPGFTIKFALEGDADYGQVTGGGTGGWQVVDRPKQPAATQWYDRSPYQLVLPLLMDSSVLNGGFDGISIELPCLQVESWFEPIPGTLQPAVLTVTGPVPGIQRQWVAENAAWAEAVRDPSAGFRTQQTLKLTLYEYLPPITSQGGPTPAQAAAQGLLASQYTSSYWLYTARLGDTLSSVAAAKLGSYAAWTRLATLNSIRDPNSLLPGQVIRIPWQ